MTTRRDGTAKGAAKTSAPKQTKLKITFVCTGNTCRSAMAQLVMRDKIKTAGESEFFDVKSAGLSVKVGEGMSEPAKSALKKRGYKLYSHRAKPLSAAMRKSDLIVTMTESQRDKVGGENTYCARDLIGEDISDPFGGSAADYSATLELIERLCEEIFAAAQKIKNRDKL